MITVEQKKWTKEGWQTLAEPYRQVTSNLVFAFGGSKAISRPKVYEEIRKMYPEAEVFLCSTAGEILGTSVSDDTISLTALSFDSTKVETLLAKIDQMESSEETGRQLGGELPTKGLVHVMVLSDGLNVNGTALVRGLSSMLPKSVSVTGGLVGDGPNFKHTYVGLNGPAKEKQVAVVGFYGRQLQVGYGSLGGWDPFGPERVITKSEGNVLLELDGKPALDLYKEYLGNKAKDLPGSGLLFPLSLRVETNGGETNVVRTLLAVDEKAKSMTFAGDMPEGVLAKLMKANFDRLVDGASGAASMSLQSLKSKKPELAILISCIGRKLVLKDRTEEELEAVQNLVGEKAAITGFYSYGEICPTAPTEKQCQLHNQTMTITVFKEG